MGKFNWGNNDLIILTDDNIDSSSQPSFNKKIDIKHLSDILNDSMQVLNITQCNNNYTRITSHQPPSCIDKIFSNVPHKINNVQTINNINSDHHYVTAIFNSKEPLYTPRFFIKRCYKQLTKHNIEQYINYSNLNSIYNSNDPDFIANTIQLELNTIYNILAPSKIVQYKNNYTPYHTNEIREKNK